MEFTMKYSSHYIIIFLLAFGCNNRNNKTQRQNIENEVVKTSPNIIASDSNKFLHKLNSLPKLSFPFLSEFFNRNFYITIDLSEFKNKKLFNMPLKKIPVSLGGIIDGENADSTFDLTDENYIG